MVISGSTHGTRLSNFKVISTVSMPSYILVIMRTFPLDYLLHIVFLYVRHIFFFFRYNEGDFDERRADGYMNAFQPILANVPWVPVVGNHEFYSSAELNRYLDQTWETYGDIPDETKNITITDTATSALGSFLSKGNFYAAQSNTSRYFSLDIGLVRRVRAWTIVSSSTTHSQHTGTFHRFGFEHVLRCR